MPNPDNDKSWESMMGESNLSWPPSAADHAQVFSMPEPPLGGSSETLKQIMQSLAASTVVKPSQMLYELGCQKPVFVGNGKVSASYPPQTESISDTLSLASLVELMSKPPESVLPAVVPGCAHCQKAFTPRFDRFTVTASLQEPPTVDFLKWLVGQPGQVVSAFGYTAACAHRLLSEQFQPDRVFQMDAVDYQTWKDNRVVDVKATLFRYWTGEFTTAVGHIARDPDFCSVVCMYEFAKAAVDQKQAAAKQTQRLIEQGTPRVRRLGDRSE